ncbi:MAG: VWA domain-containing protein [Verrucomicrobiota bacterium]
MFAFLHPWVFVLLVLPLLLKHLLPAHHEKRPAVRVPFLNRLARLTGKNPASGSAVLSRSHAQSLAAWVFWISIVTALARPQYFEPPITHVQATRDLLLAIDLSASMQIEDFTDASGKIVDRLTATKQVVDDFLKRREGDRVGLILFGNAAFVQVPFTTDLNVCRELLNEAQVGMAGPKTAIGDAIGLAINVFDRSEQTDRVLILLTDGNDTSSKVPPADAARIAKDKAIVIHTIAMGDPEAAGEDKLDTQSLKEIADTTNGEFFQALNRKQLEQIYVTLDQLDTREIESVSYRPRHEMYFWPLAFAILTSLLFQIGMVYRDRSRQCILNSEPTHD